jgi:ornithine cyclodeaminase/alanine dehydrogenase-like protein (mu-crystallin family)
MVRFFSESDVQRLLPMSDAIRLMHSVFEDLGRGNAQNQPRRRLTAGGAVLHTMAGAWRSYFGAKIYSTHPKHGAWFLFVLYDTETARPLALFEANRLGQIRTGAASGFAADILARRDARVLGIIGSGFQARSQLEAILQVRDIVEVRVWSRSPKRLAFARECVSAFGVPVNATDSAEEAVRGADIVVTATYSKEPVLEAAWIAPGTHVIAMGSNQAQRRELPAELIRRASLIAVDSVEQARIESGDLLLGLTEEEWSRVVELAELALAPATRQTGAITIFKSNGLGVEDVAAAAFIWEQKSAGEDLPLFHS